MGKSRSRIYGFSLVEIAIVLVIAALIIAGIFAGRNLLEKTSSRTLATDVNGVHEAIKQFQKTYNAVPGDMYDATTRLGPTATNGNGNGVLDAAEYPVVWQHLALAGLIPGQYNPAVAQPGVGLMAAKFGKEVGLEVVTEPTAGTLAIRISRFDPTAATMNHGFIPPQQAQQLDEKFDDGNPDTGNIRAYTDGGAGGNCKSGGAYAMQETRQNCVLTFLSAELNQGDAAAVTLTETIIGPGTEITECEAGQPIGSTKTVPCPTGMTGNYSLICREGGVWEFDPSGAYSCTFPPCPATSVADSLGNMASYPATVPGNTAIGSCTNANMRGYNPSGTIDAAYPTLTCFSPGGAAGWRQTSTGRQLPVGTCDTVCTSAQLTGNGQYQAANTGTSIAQPFTEENIGRGGPTVTLTCNTGFSNANTNASYGGAGGAAVVGDQDEIVACHPTAGTGWTRDTTAPYSSVLIALNCQPNCQVSSVTGYTVASHNPDGDFARGSTINVTCQAPWVAQSGTGAVTCQANGTITGTAQVCYNPCTSTTANCGNGATCTAMPTPSAHGTAVAKTCPGGQWTVGSPMLTCNNGTWQLTSGTCYSNCWTGSAWIAHGQYQTQFVGSSCGTCRNQRRLCTNGAFGGWACYQWNGACPPPPPPPPPPPSCNCSGCNHAGCISWGWPGGCCMGGCCWCCP